MAMKVTVAVPTGWPCWAMTKLPAWAGATAGIKARSPASGRKANVRKGVCILPDRLDTGIGKELRRNGERGLGKRGQRTGEGLWFPTLSATGSGKDGARSLVPGLSANPRSQKRDLGHPFC